MGYVEDNVGLISDTIYHNIINIIKLYITMVSCVKCDGNIKFVMLVMLWVRLMIPTTSMYNVVLWFVIV